jgi:translation initiation factor 1A
MPPNKKGGKNYKKGKSADAEPELYICEDDQMYGRVVKLLGNCNVLVFCNDGYERLCHIRGKMRKKVWISPGDIVLVSLRDMDPHAKKGAERGDICAKYDSKVLQRLKDTAYDINPKLFTMIETADIDSSKMRGDIDGFEFDENGDDNDNSGQSSSESDVDESMRPANRLLQQRVAMMDNDDDFNIDDL